MLILILIGIIAIILINVILKPYFIKYDTTLLMTGGLGTGKTLTCVKKALQIYKKTCLSIKWENFKIRLFNKIRKRHNKKVDKRIKACKTKHINKWQIVEEHEKPRLITNIPVRISKRKGWATVLTKEMLMLTERIPEYSVVLIDETPQMINQFNWNVPDVQNNVNELITFYRHYTGGKLILSAQADSEIVKQIRSKMNTYYHLTNFRKLFHFFYKIDICQFIASEVVDNVSTAFYEDNVKTTYGCLFSRHYDSRCFSIRYDKTKEKKTKYKVWAKFKTNKIIRFNKNYESPLDDKESK